MSKIPLFNFTDQLAEKEDWCDCAKEICSKGQEAEWAFPQLHAPGILLGFLIGKNVGKEELFHQEELCSHDFVMR